MKTNLYGCKDVNEAELRNKEKIMAIELAATLIGSVPWQEINDDDKNMYMALKAYADKLRARY